MSARAGLHRPAGTDHPPLLEDIGYAVLFAIELATAKPLLPHSTLHAIRALRVFGGLTAEVTRRVAFGFYRDLAGRPHDLDFDPAWRTSTAVALAQQMYESRDFAAMPILADALQDAGCEHADVLSHCRGPDKPNNGFPPHIPTAPFVHVRGCWVVDAVLGNA